MGKHKHEFSGSSDSSGKFFIFNRQLFDNFVKLHPDKQFQGELNVVIMDDNDPLRKYYWVEVIPKLQQGLRAIGYNFNREETHDFVKQFSPVMEDHVMIGDKKIIRYKSIKKGKISNSELYQYIEDLKRFGAEELFVIINDPNEFKRLS